MANSLFEQLKKAGLADKKKLDKIRTEKHQQTKQQHLQQKKKRKNTAAESEVLAHTSASIIGQQKKAEKLARDQQLNAERKTAADQKALAAQIKQLIQTHRQKKIIENKDSKKEEPLNYNFVDNGKVKKIHVSSKVQQQLTRDQLAIVKFEDGYELVPIVVAEKILSRDTDYPVIRNTSDAAEDEDNEYKDYKIPDDLMW